MRETKRENRSLKLSPSKSRIGSEGETPREIEREIKLPFSLKIPSTKLPNVLENVQFLISSHNPSEKNPQKLAADKSKFLIVHLVSQFRFGHSFFSFSYFPPPNADERNPTSCSGCSQKDLFNISHRYFFSFFSSAVFPPFSH